MDKNHSETGFFSAQDALSQEKLLSGIGACVLGSALPWDGAALHIRGMDLLAAGDAPQIVWRKKYGFTNEVL